MNSLSHEDWEALEEMFEALESASQEQSELFSTWESMPAADSDEEAGCPA